MEYLSFNSIAKRCPNGKWLDRETGECISQSEWKRKYRKNAPADEPPKEKTGKCPKGYWKDRRTGQCIKTTEWRERPGAGKPRKEKPKEQPPKEEQPPEIPPHVDYPEIKYGSRSSDIPTKEAEWIFSQGSDEKAWKSKLSENKEAIKSVRSKLNKAGETDAEGYYSILCSEPQLNFELEDTNLKEGSSISGRREYKYYPVTKINPEKAKNCVEAILTAKENLYMPHGVKLGAMTSTGVAGANWSQYDGSSELRLNYEVMNRDRKFPYWESDHEAVAKVKGYETTTTPIHEMTHAYINSLVHDFIVKGKGNGMIDANSSIYKGLCVDITHGDIPKDWGSKPMFSSRNCKRKEYESIGRFTQTVVSDAKKVAKALYGMESDTFRSQMTLYGRTKDKEGIPEAVSDYLTNGEDASLANKLIYFSLQRYAKFVYSDDKELAPIGDYIKELRAKQKGTKPRKKTKSIRKEKEYISFSQLGLVRL